MAQKPKSSHPNMPPELRKYLVPTEKVIFHLHRHWVALFRPVIASAAGLLVVVLLQVVLPDKIMMLGYLTAVAWLGILGWLAYEAFDWRREHFVATDKRLILVHGIFVRKVAMMPMGKVTDMRYDRTVPGKVFGYGVFIMESAGQVQALSKINFLPNPDENYRKLSAVLFPPAKRRHAETLIAASTGSQLPITEPEPAWWRRP
jgi:hypothetical protein